MAAGRRDGGGAVPGRGQQGRQTHLCWGLSLGEGVRLLLPPGALSSESEPYKGRPSPLRVAGALAHQLLPRGRLV